VKIALCISGQPRTWKRCYQTWFDAVSHLGDVDVFYHMWDFNTYPNFIAKYVKGPLEDVPLTKNELDEIYETLKPKKFEIASKRTFPRPSVENPIAWWTQSQFYGLKKAAFIKRQYEIEHDIEYDLACRIRTDLVLDYKVPDIEIRPNMMYTCVNHHDPEYNTFRVGDIFYYCDSYTYDQMSYFYDAMDYIDATDVLRSPLVYPPELAFYFYMKSLGINNTSVTVPCKIARTKDYETIKGELAPYEIL
jgi:hypothetical protein